MNLSLIKQNAKNILSNHKYLYGYTFFYFLILVVGGFILNLIPFVGGIGSIALSMFMSLLAVGFTYQLSNNQLPDINILFEKVKKYLFVYLWYLAFSWPIIVAIIFLMGVSGIMVFLGLNASIGMVDIDYQGISMLIVALLFFILSTFISIYSIILYFNYSLCYYVAVDDSANDLRAKDCLKTCKAMMKGYKMKLFIFNLSFIGWFLLTGITFGLAGLYVLPYYQLSLANFYNEIKSDYMNRNRYNY